MKNFTTNDINVGGTIIIGTSDITRAMITIIVTPPLSLRIFGFFASDG